jgi:hypothetical protein
MDIAFGGFSIVLNNGRLCNMTGRVSCILDEHLHHSAPYPPGGRHKSSEREARRPLSKDRQQGGASAIRPNVSDIQRTWLDPVHQQISYPGKDRFAIDRLSIHGVPPGT